MAENVELLKTHTSLLNDQLAKNSARVEKTKQVINQYEEQIKFLKEIPATLKKSVLIPVGTKGFLRGHIVHTNEIYHNVGCGYVIKRTAKQAIDFCDRMLAETNNFLQQLLEEEKRINEQMKLSVGENVFQNQEQLEIVENYDEETEREWRLKHRDSIKRMKQEEARTRENISMSDDDDVFSRLDELELLEEIEQMNEDFEKSTTVVHSPVLNNAKININDNLVQNSELTKTDETESNLECKPVEISATTLGELDSDVKTNTNSTATSQYSSNEEKLRKELTELEKNKRKSEIKRELAKTRKYKTHIQTPDDIFRRLDELEREENLLDEMELLDCADDSQIENSEKNITIRFNEQVRTNFYDCNQAVSDEMEQLPISDDQSNKPIEKVDSNDTPVTLELRFSHSDNEPVSIDTETKNNTEVHKAITKPSDLYDLPYRPKSILKNKNKLFEEPQHTGNFDDQQISYLPTKKRERGHRDRNWVCCDTFPKNDSDQENANTVQISCPLSEVKEKTDNFVNVPTPVAQPKKRQSRFSVSRALLTKK